MGFYRGPKIVTDGLIMYYDTDNVKSYVGRPTTNIASTSLSNYNNVPSNVTTVLTATSEFYKDSVVYKQTLTAIDATGVSYLTNANNPGIGVLHGGGGGLANRYTGHSIFFKPDCPMNVQPIFTNYSNIVGWQTSGQYDDMGDGWFRAKVIWYDTVTRTDNKYWAINPLSSTIGVPLTIYWAGPFKEDLNSQYISQYTLNTRTQTQGLLSLLTTPSINIDLTNMSYDSTSKLIFNGTSSYITSPHDTKFNILPITIESYVYWTSGGGLDIFNKYYSGSLNGYRIGINSNGTISIYYFRDGSNYIDYGTSIGSTSANTWYHIVATFDISGVIVYINGVVVGTKSWIGTPGPPTTTQQVEIGRYPPSVQNAFFNGKIPIIKIYNTALTSSEILQNFNALKNRFGL